MSTGQSVTIDRTVTGYSYWELRWGGLFDSRSHDGLMHLVGAYRGPRGGVGGTPGSTLCGIDRFAKDGPGGGWKRKSEGKPVCGDCVAAATARGLEEIVDP